MTVDRNLFQIGDLALIQDRKGRRNLLTLADGQVFHSHLGRLDHDKLIGQSVGAWYRTDKGHVVLAVRPTLGDFVLQMPRGPQIVYPKDLGLIVTLGDIFPGATVIEGGLGSGALTSALLRAVGDKGRVINYEIQESWLPKAKSNIKKILGETPNLEIKIGDIYEGISETDVDRVVLDVPEPWQAVSTVGDCLVMGGILLSFLPTVLQVQKLVLALEADTRFQIIETTETLLRTWHVTERSVRPDHRMVAHSGFLTTAVRCQPRLIRTPSDLSTDNQDQAESGPEDGETKGLEE